MSVVLTGLIFMLFSGGWVMPEGIMILHCFGLIITGALGLWCVSTAMSLADVSAISPFRYVRIVFGMSAGVIVFGEHLDIPTLLGSAIIVGAGLYSWHHERRLVQES
jgi:drug/metabolite transporter (DMT)-like permease